MSGSSEILRLSCPAEINRRGTSVVGLVQTISESLFPAVWAAILGRTGALVEAVKWRILRHANIG